MVSYSDGNFIAGTGLISSWFVEDLILSRPDAKARHIVQAIGSSSVEKGRTFIEKHLPSVKPVVYGSYDQLYRDPDVDIVYIGTPHAFHRKNCLDAISAGKHVLCEKAFAITAKEAREVLAAAKAKGVFVMEAMWTRFTPLVRSLREKLFKEKVIGDVRRTFCDFGLEMNIAALGSESRLKNPELGAGSLLDIGIYSLTWGLLSLDPGTGDEAEEPKIVGVQSLSDQVDIMTSVILHYASTGRHGVLTSSTEVKTDRAFCRIEGTKGTIVVEGVAASVPETFTVYSKTVGSASRGVSTQTEAETGRSTIEFEKIGKGFYWEADAVALDIAAGRYENEIMPHSETVRVMEMMDEIRRQGGARFPQDQD